MEYHLRHDAIETVSTKNVSSDRSSAVFFKMRGVTLSHARFIACGVSHERKLTIETGKSAFKQTKARDGREKIRLSFFIKIDEKSTESENALAIMKKVDRLYIQQFQQSYRVFCRRFGENAQRIRSIFSL